MEQQHRLRGFLNKQGPRALMGLSRRRWFNLEGNNLVYYSQPGDTKSLGFIPLNDVSNIIRKNEKTFILVTPHRDWVLSAPNSDVIDKWMSSVQQILSKSQLQDKLHPPKPPVRNKLRRDTDITKYKEFAQKVPKPTPPPVPVRRNTKPTEKKTPPPIPARKKTPLNSGSTGTRPIIYLEEKKLKQLIVDKENCENEEMKLLLKSLTFKKPFPEEEVNNQKKKEIQILEFESQIAECEQKLGKSPSRNSNHLPYPHMRFFRKSNPKRWTRTD